MLPFDCGQSSAKMFSRLGFSQHPDEHRPERPVLLAARLGVRRRSWSYSKTR
jgi:hypothetical protein